MNATVSPVPLMSSTAMRWGVWRSPAVLPSALAPASATQMLTWRAEWQLGRAVQFPPAVLSRWWWVASVLGVFILAGAASGMAHGANNTGSAIAGLLLVSGLGRCLLCTYGRHTDDHDHIAMHAERVHVACHRGGRTASFDCHPRWVRIEPVDHDRSLIRLSGQGSSVIVGEFVPRHERRQLAHELRWAVRHLDDRC